VVDHASNAARFLGVQVCRALTGGKQSKCEEPFKGFFRSVRSKPLAPWSELVTDRHLFKVWLKVYVMKAATQRLVELNMPPQVIAASKSEATLDAYLGFLLDGKALHSNAVSRQARQLWADERALVPSLQWSNECVAKMLDIVATVMFGCMNLLDFPPVISRRLVTVVLKRNMTAKIKKRFISRFLKYTREGKKFNERLISDIIGTFVETVTAKDIVAAVLYTAKANAGDFAKGIVEMIAKYALLATPRVSVKIVKGLVAMYELNKVIDKSYEFFVNCTCNDEGQSCTRFGDCCAGLFCHLSKCVKCKPVGRSCTR
jgi:hypothetical protein